MTDFYTEIWTIARPLMAAGWLEGEEITAASSCGIRGKEGVARKIVEFLQEQAADPVHRREQLTMHRYGITRNVLHKLQAIRSLDALSVKSMKKLFGTDWERWRRLLINGDWIAVSYGPLNEKISKIRTTEKFQELFDYYDTMEVPLT